MRVERTTIVLALLLIVTVGLMNAWTALADPVNPTALGQVNSSRGTLNTGTQSLEAQAGNVTEVSLNSTTITSSWAGFYGDVTGNITLQNAGGDKFYDWAIASPSGEVFASRSNSITWADVNCSNAGNITSEETALGHSATDADSVTNTFSATNHPSFSIGSNTITGCPTTNAYDNTGAQTSRFFNVLLSESDGDTVYTTLLNASSTGFDGGTYDFELLVGEDGHGAAASTTTTYYFYVELN